MLSFAAASAAFSPGRGLADAAGHDHGAAATTCATYEFGGIYAVPTGAGQVYTFSAPMVAGACDEWVAQDCHGASLRRVRRACRARLAGLQAVWQPEV